MRGREIESTHWNKQGDTHGFCYLKKKRISKSLIKNHYAVFDFDEYNKRGKTVFSLCRPIFSPRKDTTPVKSSRLYLLFSSVVGSHDGSLSSAGRRDRKDDSPGPKRRADPCF